MQQQSEALQRMAKSIEKLEQHSIEGISLCYLYSKWCI